MRIAVFDMDGTLVDSDEALADAFVKCGVPREMLTRGHVVADECARLKIELSDYLDAYDVSISKPFPGVQSLLEGLDAVGCRWAVCSNKHPESGRAELARLGWNCEVALFADAFNGPKSLGPVLLALGVESEEILFVGDTPHDAACAEKAGCKFAWAGWNPLCTRSGSYPVLAHPEELMALIRT